MLVELWMGTSLHAAHRLSHRCRGAGLVLREHRRLIEEGCRGVLFIGGNAGEAGRAVDYGMTLETAGGVPVYMSRALLEKDGILVLFSTRRGGRSLPPYDTLNLALHVGDDPERVLENRRILCALHDLDPSRMTCAEQVHGCEVAFVDDARAGSGAFVFEEAVRGVDALATDIEAVPLALFFADCVPVVVVEPHARIVGVAHAGWRGVYCGIAAKIVREMVARWPIRSESLVAFIGPSIGGCCFEVGADVIAKFSERFPESDRWLKEGRIDLRALVAEELSRAGMSAPNIFSCGDSCTACDTASLFSHRGEGGATGRQAAIAAIMPRHG